MYSSGSFVPASDVSKAVSWISSEMILRAFTGVSTLTKFHKLAEAGELIVFRLCSNTKFAWDVQHGVLLTQIQFKLNVSHKCLCVLVS